MNNFQFYNEFLFQQHKSLIKRLEKCEAEENCSDFQKLHEQEKQTGVIEKIGDSNKKLEIKLVTTIDEAAAESEVDITDRPKKLTKSLRHRRAKRSLPKIQNDEEHETSSLETESKLNSPKKSVQNRSQKSNTLHINLKANTETKEEQDYLQQQNKATSKIAFENVSVKIETCESNLSKIRNDELPENLETFDDHEPNLHNIDEYVSIFDDKSDKFKKPEKSFSNFESLYKNFYPSQNEQFNTQMLMHFNNFQTSEKTSWNYFQFYETQQNFHTNDISQNFVNKNESLNQINASHNHFNPNTQNFNENYTNSFKLNTKWENQEIYAKPSQNLTKTSQAHQNLNQLFPYTNQLNPNCNKPSIQSLSIPIQSSSTSSTFKCDNCPKIFKSFVRLKNHIEKHHSRKLAYKCKYCRSSFKRQSKLLNHQHKSHSEKFATYKKSSIFHNVELLAQSDCHSN